MLRMWLYPGFPWVWKVSDKFLPTTECVPRNLNVPGDSLLVCAADVCPRLEARYRLTASGVSATLAGQFVKRSTHLRPGGYTRGYTL